jgi:hypothetical protein
MVIGSKPPPMGHPTRAIDVSLISGMGQIAVASPNSIAPVLEPVATNPAVSKSAVATEASSNAGSTPVPKPKPEPDAPHPPTPILTAIVAGGPDLTAKPISINPQPAQAPPVLSQTAGGAHCELVETIKRNLQSNESAKAALLLIPKKSLSIANAILLWDGHWIDESDIGGADALRSIEQTVVQTISQTPAMCQGEVLHGPRFIILDEAGGAMVLAFGSADWRWSDLSATLSPHG